MHDPQTAGWHVKTVTTKKNSIKFLGNPWNCGGGPSQEQNGETTNILQLTLPSLAQGRRDLIRFNSI